MGDKGMIKEWAGYNFLGWLLGMILGPVLYYDILSPYIRHGLHEKLEPLIISVPIGLFLGVMQYIKLRHWKISPMAWIGATALGFGIPITLISWFLQSFFGNDVPLLAAAGTAVLAGLLVGGLQAALMRRSIVKPGLWMLIYGLGLLAIAVSTGTIVVGALWGIDRFEYQLLSFGLGVVVRNFDRLLELFIVLVSSTLAAVFIGLPTGLILQKSSKKNISVPIE